MTFLIADLIKMGWQIVEFFVLVFKFFIYSMEAELDDFVIRFVKHFGYVLLRYCCHSFKGFLNGSAMKSEFFSRF